MVALRNTKIVATLGPASNTPEAIRALCEAGVNVFRLNFSHGSYEDHERAIQTIRSVEKTLGRPVAIMLDLQGPKLRIGLFADGVVPLEVGQEFQLDLDKTPGNSSRVFFGHPDCYSSLTPGTEILLDDGKVVLSVIEQKEDRIRTTVVNGREISNHKGVNLPGVMLAIESMTEKDERDLAFGVQHEIDWVAVSFVQSAADIERARSRMPDHLKVIAKIEKPLAIANLESILEAADAIMIARGDLGVEVPLEQVPGLQKRILHVCRQKGKPVIVATQMMDSMVQSPTPTRAEVSDVATAVYEGADAVMLSAESASGRYPVNAVQIMDRIIRQTEAEMASTTPTMPLSFDPKVCSAVVAAAPYIAENAGVKAIAVLSQTGTCVQKVARGRPKAPIFTVSDNMHTARYLELVWGVHAFHLSSLTPRSFDDLITIIQEFLVEHAFVAGGDSILVVTGRSYTTPLKISTLHLVHL